MKKDNADLSRGFTPTPTLASFRFFKILSLKIAMLFQKLISVRNDSETKKTRQSWCGGFTILEIIIVISILGVIFSMILPSLTSFRQKSILNTEAQGMTTLINKARLSSMSSKNDQQYGIHFEAGKIVLFEGTTYTAGAGTNEEHLFDTVLTLAPITINGGGAETVFQKITGGTNQNSTTTLKVIVNNSASTTIIILPSGIATIF